MNKFVLICLSNQIKKKTFYQILKKNLNYKFQPILEKPKKKDGLCCDYWYNEIILRTDFKS